MPILIDLATRERREIDFCLDLGFEAFTPLICVEFSSASWPREVREKKRRSRPWPRRSMARAESRSWFRSSTRGFEPASREDKSHGIL